MAKIKIVSEIKPKLKVIETKKEETLEEEIDEIEQDSIQSRFGSSERLSTGLISASEGAQETPELPQQPTAQTRGEDVSPVSYGTPRTAGEERERKYGVERERNRNTTMAEVGGPARTAGIIRREAQPEIERGRITGDRSQLFPQNEEEEERYEARIPKQEPSPKRRMPWE